MSQLRNQKYQTESGTLYSVATWIEHGKGFARIVETGEILVDGAFFEDFPASLAIALETKNLTKF